MWLLQAFDAKSKCYVLLGPFQLAWQAGSSEGAGPRACAAYVPSIINVDMA